jgi:hypothetical protein
MVMDGDAGQSKIITYRTAGLQRFGLYVNNTAESGSNAGSDFAVRAYSDAGTLLSTALFIKRSTGNVGINTTAPFSKLELQGPATTYADSASIVFTDSVALPDSRRWLVGNVATDYGSLNFAVSTTATDNPVNSKMTITKEGNVGIGTTTPAVTLVSNGKIRSTRTSVASQYVEVDGGDAAGGYVRNTGVGKVFTIVNNSTSSSDVVFDQAVASPYMFRQLGTQILRIDSDGIKFGTDTAAANALDDYEEGTFTATLTPSTSGSITLTPSTCSYTKIGRQVTVRGQVVVSAISSPIGGTVILGGLPFTSNSAVSSRGAGVVQYFPSIGGNSLLNNYQLQTSVEWIWILNASTVLAGDEFYMSLTYFV